MLAHRVQDSIDQALMRQRTSTSRRPFHLLPPAHSPHWILTITDPAAEHTIIFSELTLAEVAAALAAKQRAPQGV